LVALGDLVSVFDVDHQPQLVHGDIRAFPAIDRDAHDRLHPFERETSGYFGLDALPAL